MNYSNNYVKRLQSQIKNLKVKQELINYRLGARIETLVETVNWSHLGMLPLKSIPRGRTGCLLGHEESQQTIRKLITREELKNYVADELTCLSKEIHEL